jgi:hypothetical protein
LAGTILTLIGIYGGNAGIPPQISYAAWFLLFADMAVLRGALLETALRKTSPERLRRVARHEAGHWLLAHIVGFPVHGCSFDPGGSGTAVLVPGAGARMPAPIADRYAIVLMGGIAAEALEYGAAEGGKDDEFKLRELVRFLGGNEQQAAELARWAATNAVLLIRENYDAYKRLVAELDKDEGRSVGECVLAMEGVTPRIVV